MTKSYVRIKFIWRLFDDIFRICTSYPLIRLIHFFVISLNFQFLIIFLLFTHIISFANQLHLNFSNLLSCKIKIRSIRFYFCDFYFPWTVRTKHRVTVSQLLISKIHIFWLTVFIFSKSRRQLEFDLARHFIYFTIIFIVIWAKMSQSKLIVLQ
jgi:hypothetical protein